MKRALFFCVLACLSVCAEAKIVTLQVTIGAGATQIAAPGVGISCKWLVVQNNAAHSFRVGDANVSSSRGMQLISGSSFYQGVYQSPTSLYLSGWYVVGTSGDVVDVVYEDGN